MPGQLPDAAVTSASIRYTSVIGKSPSSFGPPLRDAQTAWLDQASVARPAAMFIVPLPHADAPKIDEASPSNGSHRSNVADALAALVCPARPERSRMSALPDAGIAGTRTQTTVDAEPIPPST